MGSFSSSAGITSWSPNFTPFSSLFEYVSKPLMRSNYWFSATCEKRGLTLDDLVLIINDFKSGQNYLFIQRCIYSNLSVTFRGQISMFMIRCTDLLWEIGLPFDACVFAVSDFEPQTFDDVFVIFDIWE